MLNIPWLITSDKVIMMASPLGLVFLKKFGYILATLIFELSAMIWLLIFFLFFDFHTGDALKKNYITIEIVVIVLTYIFQIILVGSSSIISLKELVREREFCEFSCFKKENKNKHFLKVLKLLIYLLNSCLSLLCTILINKLIFKIYGNYSTSKKFLLIILIITFSSYLFSIFFYLEYTACLSEFKLKKYILCPKRNWLSKKKN